MAPGQVRRLSFVFKPRREPKMQIGFNLPISGSMSSPEALTWIAQQGEKLGYNYLTLTDHIVLPNLRVPGYPYSESGEFFEEGPERRHEQLTTAAFIAAKTSSIRLVLAVMVVPHRPAVLAAKMLATIDVLSHGRLVVGIGAGWLQAEFDAVVTPPFAERGRVTDEYLSALRNLWAEEAPRFDGRWAKFDGISFEPKPAQQPHPPIWVGGESGPSLRRAARLGDAWYPIGSNNRHPLDTLARYRAGIDRLRRLTAEAGRDPASVALTYRVKRYGETLPSKASDGERRLFSGSAANIVNDLKGLQALGVCAIDIDVERPNAEASITELRRFQEDVVSFL
jgi:probable F420-dependent oxidoreductase